MKQPRHWLLVLRVTDQPQGEEHLSRGEVLDGVLSKDMAAGIGVNVVLAEALAAPFEMSSGIPFGMPYGGKLSNYLVQAQNADKLMMLEVAAWECRLCAMPLTEDTAKLTGKGKLKYRVCKDSAGCKQRQRTIKRTTRGVRK